MKQTNWKNFAFIVLVFAVTVCAFSYSKTTFWGEKQMVRMAKIVIDSTQLDAYKAYLKEEIEASLRVEAGVLALNAVSDKKNPTHITILEVYADTNAYRMHIQTPHFQKYKIGTKDMVKSLELIDVLPVALESKNR
jgi:quinol monooxygenase YgiN